MGKRKQASYLAGFVDGFRKGVEMYYENIQEVESDGN